MLRCLNGRLGLRPMSLFNLSRYQLSFFLIVRGERLMCSAESGRLAVDPGFA